jgi:hypothetical protein
LVAQQSQVASIWHPEITTLVTTAKKGLINPKIPWKIMGFSREKITFSR